MHLDHVTSGFLARANKPSRSGNRAVGRNVVTLLTKVTVSGA